MDVDTAISIARVLFWVMCASILFLPLRWAFVCLIVASHLDITTSSFTSSAAIGFENTVRILGLPAILLARMHFVPLKNISWKFPHKVWLALIAYVAAATTWSDFRLSGLKMVAYLVMYFVVYAIFSEAWAAGLLDVKRIRLATLFVIGLAFVQTYEMGNTSGVEDRLTSFSTPQYFAAYLLAALAILVFSEERGVFHYGSCAAILGAIVLAGSRYIFVSAILLFVVSSVRSAIGRHAGFEFKTIWKRALATVIILLLVLSGIISFFPSSRIDDFLRTFVTRDASIEDVGTWAWRLKIYAEIFNQLSGRSASQLFFGSGTSSGAALMLELEPSLYSETGEEAVDGNRVLHNEFLRSLYEWGVPGLMLLLLFLVSICVGFMRRVTSTGGGPALTFIGVFPSILFGLAIENLLAGAVSAAGIGIVLAMTYAWEGVPVPMQEEPRPSDFEIGEGNVQVRI
jgi:hypothetical protein